MEFDYIVIGAGSAGCVVASRLSEDPSVSVLLVEAGPPDDHYLIQMPMGFPLMAMNPRYAWNFMTEPQEHRGFGAEMWPRGRMLGGSSSLNGMLYLRGQPQDYEDWAAATGQPTWRWAEVSRCFRELESHSLGESDLRGGKGPLAVTAGSPRSDLSETIVAAGEEMGLTRREDFNGPEQEGIGYFAANIRSGRRFSAARAHLQRAANRRNLTISSETTVQRIIFEGTRAVGVEATRAGQPLTFRARAEIVVSAGTILTPRLLMVSGIGDGEALSQHGITVVAENPHVGRHLRDHVGVRVAYRVQGARGNNWRLRGPGLALSALQYALTRKGMLASTGEVGAFIRAHPQATRPDGQLMLSAISQGPAKPGTYMGVIDKVPGFTAACYVMNPDSEGQITLASADPAANPRIQPNALSTDHDQVTLVEIVKFVRRLVRQPALAPYITEETSPGPSVESDDEVRAFVRRTARNFNHAVGTCRMGTPETGAVDDRLRVHGVQRLRVVDCSVMPAVPAGNTNGPAQMVGWRAAELIREDRKGHRT